MAWRKQVRAHHLEAVSQRHHRLHATGHRFDKFRIIRHLGEALDHVRKSEYVR